MLSFVISDIAHVDGVIRTDGFTHADGFTHVDGVIRTDGFTHADYFNHVDGIVHLDDFATKPIITRREQYLCFPENSCTPSEMFRGHEKPIRPRSVAKAAVFSKRSSPNTVFSLSRTVRPITFLSNTVCFITDRPTAVRPNTVRPNTVRPNTVRPNHSSVPWPLRESFKLVLSDVARCPC